MKAPDVKFRPATVVPAEGARVGLFICEVCWACVLGDPREKMDALAMHALWHETISEGGDA